MEAKIPKLQDLDDFISFIRFHVPQTSTKCLVMRLMDNYLEDSIIAIKALEKIGALEINTTIDGTIWAKKTENFNKFTAKQVLDFIWDNKDSFDFSKQKEVVRESKSKRFHNIADVIDSLDGELIESDDSFIDIEEVEAKPQKEKVLEIKEEKIEILEPIKEDKMENKGEKFCVFTEDMSHIEYFDNVLDAIDFINKSDKTSYMARLIKKAVIRLVLEDV